MKYISKKAFPFFVLNLVIGVIVICLIFFSNKDNFNNKISRDQEEGFVYTSPILDCEAVSEGGSTTVAYKEFTDETENLARKYNISDFSVYFRDLNNGPWVGVNEKEFFSPASLMKTPILIGFLKNVEKHLTNILLML
jgi:hypothetical protein